MKCPKCGHEIPDDSVFCEFCSAQVKTIANISQSSGTIWKIVLGIVLLCLIAIIIREQHALSGTQAKIEDLKQQIVAIKNINFNYNEKLKALTKYSLTTGSQHKINNLSDSGWILWLNANERVYLESFDVRSNSYGSVDIGILLVMR